MFTGNYDNFETQKRYVEHAVRVILVRDFNWDYHMQDKYLVSPDGTKYGAMVSQSLDDQLVDVELVEWGYGVKREHVEISKTLLDKEMYLAYLMLVEG